MSRIFAVLALIAVLLLLANIVVGFMTGDVNGKYEELKETRASLERAKLSNDKSKEPEAAAQVKTAADAFGPFQQWMTFHVLFGVLASLVALLVNSIGITYFIGTTRWCREVVETYHLDEALIRRCNDLKRSAFPWALIGIGAVIGIIVLGGISLPGSGFENPALWVMFHYLSALVGVGLITWSFMVQIGSIGENYEVIGEIIEEVRRIRAERGLDMDAPAGDLADE